MLRHVVAAALAHLPRQGRIVQKLIESRRQQLMIM
jgi:hypothetical protein